jgi:hypothetical protein
MKYFKIQDNVISGFYDSEINEINEDMFELEENEWRLLLEKQSEGYTLTCNDGKPFPQKLSLGQTFIEGVILEDIRPMVSKLKKEITALRDTIREYSTVDYNGHQQRFRKSDLSDIDGYQRRLERKQLVAQGEENALAVIEGRKPNIIILNMKWFFYDGSSCNMTVEDFDFLLDLCDQPVLELYTKEATLKYMIDQMATIEELEKVDIATVWNTI